MRLDRVLVAMDFSESAIAAARWVRTWFAPEATVGLVHVVSPPERPEFAADILPPWGTLEAAVREAAGAQLRDVAVELGGPTDCDVRVGKPHEQIAQKALEMGADVIVIGPHGDNRGRPFLGTTAERVVRMAGVPVLIAIDPPDRRPRTLLVPIDESRLTSTILAWAGFVAESSDAQVKLLHVWSDAVYSHVASMARLTARSEVEARASLADALRDAATHWLADLAAAGFPKRGATVTVAHGKPGDAVLTHAAAMRADLIVMGRSGGGAIGPALFGSTLRTVLHGARCPVLVITDGVASRKA